MLGSYRSTGGSNRSRPGQILRFRSVYICGAGHSVPDSHSGWYSHMG